MQAFEIDDEDSSDLEQDDEGELDSEEAAFGDEEDGEREADVLAHPRLGPGRVVPRGADELPPVWHPRLGHGRSVPAGTSAELDDFAAELDAEIVGADGRVRVTDTTAVPFRWVCALDLYYPDPDDAKRELFFRGSGTLIGNRHVLTAGHNLTDDVQGSRGTTKRLAVRRVIATPARNGIKLVAKARAPYGSSGMRSFTAHPHWVSRGSADHDYAVLTLERALGAGALGYWGHISKGAGTKLSALDPKTIAAASVNISGYPGDKCGAKPAVGSATPAMLAKCPVHLWASTQWRSFEPVSSASSAARITYKLDTFGGHSGSPVWLRWKGVRTIVAVHTAGSGGRGFNRGVRISAEVLKNVKAWSR